ncbi:MAG: hypothetical protein NW237_03285 [Cyanobacteriota bacterium]|nr:hypothetical protein [Cyanobacteriota bacterium]
MTQAHLPYSSLATPFSPASPHQPTHRDWRDPLSRRFPLLLIGVPLLINLLVIAAVTPPDVLQPSPATLSISQP